MRRLLAVLLVLVLAPTGSARAGWFGAGPVDTGAQAFGGLDLARDGGGAVVYVKDGHVLLSRLAAGVWQAPERVDAGETAVASDPVVAAADGGALIVAWRSADRVLGAFSEGGAFSAPVALGGGDVGPPDVDLAIQRTGYVTFRQGGDVRAVRLRQGAWEAVPSALDIDPAQPAGADAGRPRVAVAADGNALVVWSEGHPDGRTRLWARRVTDLRPSALPQEVSLGELGGAPGGGADSADVAIEDDVSFAWVVWRQDIGGVSRTLARRLVGSLFEAPAVVDLGGAARAPQVSMNGDGVGLAVSQADTGDVGVSLLQRDVFGPVLAIGRGAAPLAVGAESRDVVVAWQADGNFVGRHGARDEPLTDAVALGAGGGPAELAADRVGDAALGWLQGDALVVAVWDEAAGPATLRTNRGWKAIRRPLLRWGAGTDLWGPLLHRVLVDGREVGLTAGASLKAPLLHDGEHRWQVVTVDPRGQETRSERRPVRVDTTAPSVRARVRGRRVLVQVRDAGAGVAAVRVRFGDGTATTALKPGWHRYRSGGRRRLSVRVQDAAGNAATRRLTVRLR